MKRDEFDKSSAACKCSTLPKMEEASCVWNAGCPSALAASRLRHVSQFDVYSAEFYRSHGTEWIVQIHWLERNAATFCVVSVRRDNEAGNILNIEDISVLIHGIHPLSIYEIVMMKLIEQEQEEKVPE